MFDSTGHRLFEQFVGPRQPLRPTIIQLLQGLERQGFAWLFLREVYARFPESEGCSNGDIRTVSGGARRASRCRHCSGGANKRPNPTSSSKTTAVPRFLRHIRPYLSMVDPLVWLSRLADIERRVCRIEISGKAEGTGLVGPEAVLTNWHVVK